MPFSKRIEEGVPEDTEGNAMKARGVEQGEPESDDAEGQGYRFKGATDGSGPETDDTEGQAAKAGRVEQGEPETDDTEGNAASSRH